ncbi:MAG: peptidyl-prolyl cis-trans isomerase [Thermodesulfobacteriota bacterium]|nr:MAG: peptidyl-prolyl cis-trans isomerase [Thermodesulfobacteriota bacterium]
MRGFIAALALAAMLFSPAQARAEVVDKVVAVINDSIITLSELKAATAVAMERLGVEGGAIDPEKAREMEGGILEGLIEQRLVKQAADKAGIEVSEREIDNAVDDIKKQNRLTQEQLLLALAENGLTQKEYREQLKEQIRQVKFVNREFRSRISIQPEDIEDYYRRNIDNFQSPALFRLHIIFLPGNDKDVLARRLNLIAGGLRAGEDFRDLASQYSEGPAASAGGDLGLLKSGELEPWLEEAASKLKPGEVSPAIERPEGVYFVRLSDYLPRAPRPLAEVRGEIQDRLFKKIMDERYSFWLNETRKFAHIEIRMQ